MTATDQNLFLSTSAIEPDPEQPREEFDTEYIASLASSIKAEGLLQAITVRRHPTKAEKFLIVVGECRWRAHCLLKLPTIKAVITDTFEDANRRGRLQLIENMNRRNMSFREEAFGIEKQAQRGDSDELLSESLGITLSRIQVLRRATKLPQTVWSLLDMGALASVTVEAAVGKIPFDDVEGVLLRCAGKNVNQAAVVLYDYQLSQRQEEFCLALEEAGVATRRVEIAHSLSRHLIQIADAVEKLSASDRTDFARLVGSEVAGMVAQSKRNKEGAAFLTTAFTRIHTVLDPEKS
jgi:ParB/RepB/Spo0J family partition protein